MTYGEELIIAEAPTAKASGARFLNYRSASCDISMIHTDNLQRTCLVAQYQGLVP